MDIDEPPRDIPYEKFCLIFGIRWASLVKHFPTDENIYIKVSRLKDKRWLPDFRLSFRDGKNRVIIPNKHTIITQRQIHSKSTQVTGDYTVNTLSNALVIRYTR